MKFGIITFIILSLHPFGQASEILWVAPFDEVDVAVPLNGSGADLSVRQLRYMLMHGEINEQLAAGEVLVQAGDEKSIARLVYAARQGSPESAEILMKNTSLIVVPMLLEDIAHGDVSSISAGGSDWSYGLGSVRSLAIQIVIKTLSKQSALPPQTLDWLKYLGDVANEPHMLGKAKLLLDWWIHNESALQSGKLNEAVWLPAVRTLDGESENPYASELRAPPPPPTPPPAWQARQNTLEETFDVWITRVSDPSNRDLSFSPIEMSKTLSGEIAEKNALQARSTLRKSLDPHNDTALWTIIVVLSLLISGLLWFLIKRVYSKWA